MKVNQHFGILYILLVIGQIVLCNYSQLGPYVMLSMLPAMVLCIPPGVSTIAGMFIAFFSGLSVDWLSEGLIGLNAASIVPVALMRKGIIKIFLGEDLITRGDRFSYRKNGFAKISVINKGDEIPEEQRARIFERFYRVDTARNGEGKHYGLGLAIAKAIAASHKGHIAVRCFDGFVEFGVWLPLA